MLNHVREATSQSSTFSETSCQVSFHYISVCLTLQHDPNNSQQPSSSVSNYHPPTPTKRPP